MKCFFCFRHGLTASRIRWYDWPLLLLVLRPYRCLGCGRRSIRFVWSNRGAEDNGLMFPEAFGPVTSRLNFEAEDATVAGDETILADVAVSPPESPIVAETEPVTPAEFHKQAG